MDGASEITLLMIMTVVAGISAQVLADYLKVPSIIFLLLFGALLGPSGFGLIHVDLLGNGLEVIVSLSVAIILFEGGLNLQLRELGRVSGSIRNLVTVGTMIALVGGGVASHWLGKFPWPTAFLYASLVVVTGPTVINPLLKQVSVDWRIATLLEGEGVLTDPVGAILAVVVLNIVLDGNTDPLTIVSGLALRLGIGAAIGVSGGWLLGLILRKARLSDDLKNLVVLAGLWGLYGVAQALHNESGLMTAVMAGVVLRAASLPEERLLRHFKGQLSTLAISVLFILLAADLSIASIVALGWGGVLTVLTLMLVVRPIKVLVSTWNSDLNWRQKMFLAWIGPRGIVAASVASLFSITLTNRGISGGDAIKALVFLTIIMTVVLQGLTAKWLAKWLRIESNEATGVVIIGCSPLSRLLARLIQARGEPVALIDTNPECCKQAQQENLPVFLGSALDVEILEEAGLLFAGTLLAATTNSEVNCVLAQRAMEEFRPPRVLALFPQDSEGPASCPVPEKWTGPAIQQALAPVLPLKAWNQYLDAGETKLSETVLQEETLESQQAHLQALSDSGELLPLLVERESGLRVPVAGESWQPSDRVTYLLHTPQPDSLSDGDPSSVPSALEELAQVE